VPFWPIFTSFLSPSQNLLVYSISSSHFRICSSHLAIPSASPWIVFQTPAGKCRPVDTCILRADQFWSHFFSPFFFLLLFPLFFLMSNLLLPLSLLFCFAPYGASSPRRTFDTLIDRSIDRLVGWLVDLLVLAYYCCLPGKCSNAILCCLADSPKRCCLPDPPNVMPCRLLNLPKQCRLLALFELCLVK
jgi:hypothetical protein